MSDALLFDVNLQQLPDEYLTGEWQVADRVLNSTDPESLLAQATRLELKPGELRIGGKAREQRGQWVVQRDDLLQRPYLELQLPQEHARALITRLRRSTDGLRSQLSLYFQSGMEVQLNRP